MKGLMRKFRRIRGVSLIEVLIAVSLFAIVAVLASNILVDVVQLEKKSSLQNAIYEDLRMIMQQLTKEIQNGTIDYEEYYNYYVLQDGDLVDNVYLGINYGVYGSRFYDPGKSLDPAHDPTKNPTDLGMECSFWRDDECEVVYSLSTDLNTGQNPFFGEKARSNAFCDNEKYGKCDGGGETDILFLIDNSGTKKTIIGNKAIEGGNAIGLIRMEGKDFDQNGIVDTFSCKEEFNCVPADKLDPSFRPLDKLFPGKDYYDGITVPNKEDLNNAFDPGNVEKTQFVPISPLRGDVSVKFIIEPLEDPYKAYGETDMQIHPSVTIILTIGLSEAAADAYPGEFEPITIQTTVAAGVIGRIDSYPSINHFKEEGGLSWINDVMPKELETPY
jgi:prepilin-type N-terminal cleavage/methylation domain-containing protein